MHSWVRAVGPLLYLFTLISVLLCRQVEKKMEHWLKPCESDIINIHGYKQISAFCLSTTIHGGVCVFVKNKKNIRFECLKLLESLYLEGNIEGPYFLELTQLGQCPTVENTGDYTFKSSRVNKIGRNNYTYSTTIVFKEPFTEDLDLSMNMAVLGNGGYKPNFHHYDSPGLCTSIQTFFPRVFEKLLRATNATGCPIPAGEYQMVNLPLDSFRNVKVILDFVYGKYRADVSIKSDGVTRGCLSLYVNIVPKTPKDAG